MCGIIAIVRRKTTTPAPKPSDILALFDKAETFLTQAQNLCPSEFLHMSHGDRADEFLHMSHENKAETALSQAQSATPQRFLTLACEALAKANSLLKGANGLSALLQDTQLASLAASRCEQLTQTLARCERAAEKDPSLNTAGLEEINATINRIRDELWAISEDRLGAAKSIGKLTDQTSNLRALEAYLSIHQALRALDRLEVRGRDSAGIHIMIRDHALDLTDPAIVSQIEARNQDPNFGSGSVRVATISGGIGIGSGELEGEKLEGEKLEDGEVEDEKLEGEKLEGEKLGGGEVEGEKLEGGKVAANVLSIVHKVANEIGELGDNSSSLREAVKNDALLAAALTNDTAQAVVICHTRWASVGIISEANAHPLNSEQLEEAGPYAVAALNGDVDNYADLLATENIHTPQAITTDAKVIPVLLSRRLAKAPTQAEAFRQIVSMFEGSVAIALNTAQHPDRLLLALSGSGQGLYVGLADDAFVVASEPYGLVEETSTYLRMVGESSANSAISTSSAGSATSTSSAGSATSTSRGQIVELDGKKAGTIAGISRYGYCGSELEVRQTHIETTEITTRDIDRGNNSHYLLKELKQAPSSFRKTLKGKIVAGDIGPQVRLGPEMLPERVRAGLREGAIRRIVAIGQGTAAVAASSFATALNNLLVPGQVVVESMLATELSGFSLDSQMDDVLVVAVSQSGTTTDTNRTVQLARQRGASVIAIVNRRNSDLTERVDGTLFTSDGRDVEMSVASTKAFYSQIAAGLLLAVAIANEVQPAEGAAQRSSLLSAMQDVASQMEALLERQETIAEAARQFALSRRYWAIVGNGVNRIAAREVRIKLSELCYKSMSDDSTEDKKHIDLSAEPLILVCAAGLTGSVADDVAKEVGIFRAHKAAPIVFADEGERRFDAALAVLPLPVADPRLGFILATLAGHLFGYEAALAIDAQANTLREAHSAISQVGAKSGLDGEQALDWVQPVLETTATTFFDGLRGGEYDGHLEASTAVKLATLFRFALGSIPLEAYQIEFGKVGTPAVILDDLAVILRRGIDELTRPVDAIKHQAKTVTVGISRSDSMLLEFALTQAALAAGAPRDRLSYANLRTLADLSCAVSQVLGHTRYLVDGLDTAASPTSVVVDRGGISLNLNSRTERHPTLRGTKHQVALERRVFVARGRADGRQIVVIPELKDNVTVGLTLLHVAFVDGLSAGDAQRVLRGYRNRFSALFDAVVETEEVFHEELLAEIDVVDLLCLPINVLADRWKSP